MSIIVLTRENEGRGQVTLVCKPKINMLWLVVLTLEICITLLMICREFVQAKDRGIWAYFNIGDVKTPRLFFIINIIVSLAFTSSGGRSGREVERRA